MNELGMFFLQVFGIGIACAAIIDLVFKVWRRP